MFGAERLIRLLGYARRSFIEVQGELYVALNQQYIKQMLSFMTLNGEL